MGFVNITKEEIENLKEGGSGNYLTETGIYDVKIVRVTFEVSTSGYKSANFTFEYNGNEKTIYGLGLYNKNGTENYGMNIFKSLGAICGLTTINDPVKQKVAVATKDGITSMELSVFEQFTGKLIKVNLVKTWNNYNGQIRGTLKINKFYDVDGRTAKEIAGKVAEAKQILTDEKYLNDKYSKGANDAVTKEEVEEFLRNQSEAKGETSSESSNVDIPVEDNPFAK